MANPKEFDRVLKKLDILKYPGGRDGRYTVQVTGEIYVSHVYEHTIPDLTGKLVTMRWEPFVCCNGLFDNYADALILAKDILAGYQADAVESSEIWSDKESFK